MKVFIEIECETKDEVLNHLSVIRHQLKGQLKNEKVPDVDIQVNDSNCYGDHTAWLFHDDEALFNISYDKDVVPSLSIIKMVSNSKDLSEHFSS